MRRPPPIAWWNTTELISAILSHLKSHNPELDPRSHNPAYRLEEVGEYWQKTSARLWNMSSLKLFRLERACRHNDISYFHIEDAFIKRSVGAGCSSCTANPINVAHTDCTFEEYSSDKSCTSHEPKARPAFSNTVTTHLPGIVYRL